MIAREHSCPVYHDCAARENLRETASTGNEVSGLASLLSPSNIASSRQQHIAAASTEPEQTHHRWRGRDGWFQENTSIQHVPRSRAKLARVQERVRRVSRRASGQRERASLAPPLRSLAQIVPKGEREVPKDPVAASFNTSRDGGL